MAYIYELSEHGLQEIIVQSQGDAKLFARIALYEEDGGFCNSRELTDRIKEQWGGYFYISPADALDGKNRIFLD